MFPLASGRTWRRIRPEEATPTQKAGVNASIWLVDDDDPTQRAYFKYPSPDPSAHLYSIGFERAAFTLAKILDLPVPDTYLESFEGRLGVLTMQMRGKTWFEVKSDIKAAKPTFLDRDRWGLYVAFDLLLANPDRHHGNVFVEWDPPDRGDLEGEVCRAWLFDFGFGGLFPPNKFDATNIEAVDPAADYCGVAIEYLHRQLLPEFALALPPKGDDGRRQVVEDVRRISEDQIREAVLEVPTTYMTSRAAELTIEQLVSRLGRIDRLLDDVFPT